MAYLSRLTALVAAGLKRGSYAVEEQRAQFLQEGTCLSPAWAKAGDLSDGSDRRRERSGCGRKPDLDFKTRLPAEALLPQVAWPCKGEDHVIRVFADQLGVDLLPELLEPCPSFCLRHGHTETP